MFHHLRRHQRSAWLGTGHGGWTALVAAAALVVVSACDSSDLTSPDSSPQTSLSDISTSSHLSGGEEQLYLSDSGDPGDGTILFLVELDDADMDADLTELLSGSEMSAPDFDQVDAIAASPDGATVWAVDKTSSHLGAYDVVGDNFTDMGQISGLPAGVVLAATAPDGTLWVANQVNNSVYTINTGATPPTATEVGTMSGTSFLGADFVFTAAGDLFFWTNDDTPDARGFYSLDQGTLAATYLGPEPGVTVDWFVTGLAIRDAGTGDIVSSTNEDQVRVVDASDGSTLGTFDMKLNDVAYDYEFGDMTVGELAVGEEGCTLGFWGNRALMIDAWDETDYSTGQTLEDVFDVPDSYGLDDVTLLDALGLTGGPSVADKAALLLKQAVPAILNASHPDVDYPVDAATIISDVNTALASMDAETIEELKDQLDQWNNLGSDLCGDNEEEEASSEGGPPSGVPGKGKS